MVKTVGLSQVDVLAALYNAAAPQGIGFIKASRSARIMDNIHASWLIDNRKGSGDYYTFGADGAPSGFLYFDYVNGRPIEVSLLDNKGFDPYMYDRNNGGDGTAERVIEILRETGRVDDESIQDIQEKQLQKNAIEAFEMAKSMKRFEVVELKAAIVVELHRKSLTDEGLGGVLRYEEEAGRHLETSINTALKHFNPSGQKALAAFIMLIRHHPGTAWIEKDLRLGEILDTKFDSRSSLRVRLLAFYGNFSEHSQKSTKQDGELDDTARRL